MSASPAIVAQTKYLLVAASSNPPPSEATLNVHCSVMQSFAHTQPPPLEQCQLDDIQTKVGWRRLPDNAVEAVVQVKVTAINLDTGMVCANYNDTAHRNAVSRIDMCSWIQALDVSARVWLRRQDRARRYYFRLESTCDSLSNKACDIHCAVLQRFVMDQPPVIAGAQISAPDTKVGWTRCANGDVNLELTLVILALQIHNAWVETNFRLPEHRDVADRLDVGTWLKCQDARARDWITKASEALNES